MSLRSVAVTVRTPRRPPAAPLPRQSLAFARRTGLNVKAVGSFLPGLTARAFEKFGFSTAQLVMDWPTIVGKDVALLSAPERLKWPPRRERDAGAAATGSERQRRGATLVLRVEGARALEIQYQSRQILERVNAHFGYAAVTELRLVQAPLPAARCREPGRACAQRQPSTGPGGGRHCRCWPARGAAPAGSPFAQRPLTPPTPHGDLPYLWPILCYQAKRRRRRWRQQRPSSRQGLEPEVRSEPFERL